MDSNKCWVTKNDHERERLDKITLGIDAMLAVCAHKRVPVVGLAPDGRMETPARQGVPMPSGRKIISK